MFGILRLINIHIREQDEKLDQRGKVKLDFCLALPDQIVTFPMNLPLLSLRIENIFLTTGNSNRDERRM